MAKIIAMNRIITEKMARSFWNDLMGTLHFGLNEGSHGVMSAAHIAKKMGISEEEASDFMWACVKYKLSDRANGMFVV